MDGSLIELCVKRRGLQQIHLTLFVTEIIGGGKSSVKSLIKGNPDEHISILSVFYLDYSGWTE